MTERPPEYSRTPQTPGQFEAARMDAELVESQECSECGARPRYEGRYSKTGGLFGGGSYRAFAVCDACGHVEEF